MILPLTKFCHPISSCSATAEKQRWSAEAVNKVIVDHDMRLLRMHFCTEGCVFTSISHNPRFVTRLIHSCPAPLPVHMITCGMVSFSCLHQGHLLLSQNPQIFCIRPTPQNQLICFEAQTLNISGKSSRDWCTACQSTKSKPSTVIRRWSG